jgi:hypothetical protein
MKTDRLLPGIRALVIAFAMLVVAGPAPGQEKRR